MYGGIDAPKNWYSLRLQHTEFHEVDSHPLDEIAEVSMILDEI